MAYSGQDIDQIRITADEDGKAKIRSYNYKVMFVKGKHEIDMRGRCSAGQKALASIVIRLALAETFASGCGVICLDEPTTNLDAKHSLVLAESIRNIIDAKSSSMNDFQIIIITHDKNFMSMVGQAYTESCILIQSNERGESVCEEHPLAKVL